MVARSLVKARPRAARAGPAVDWRAGKYWAMSHESAIDWTALSQTPHITTYVNESGELHPLRIPESVGQPSIRRDDPFLQAAAHVGFDHARMHTSEYASGRRHARLFGIIT